MTISRMGAVMILALAWAGGAQAATAAAPAAPPLTRVQINLSCLPNPATLTLSDCKVLSVSPVAFTALVGPGAVARAEASKMPADWQTILKKDGPRVIVPASVEAAPLPAAGRAGAAAPPAPVAAPAPAGDDVVVTLSCVPNPDLSVRDCQVLSTMPAAPGASAAALSAVAKSKLRPEWRNIYKVEDGRVILPVRLSKGPQ